MDVLVELPRKLIGHIVGGPARDFRSENLDIAIRSAVAVHPFDLAGKQAIEKVNYFDLMAERLFVMSI